MKQLRAERRLTQEGLAEHADMSRIMISQIESGRAWPSKPTLLKMAKALHVSPVRLFLSPQDVLEMIRDQDIPPEVIMRRIGAAFGLDVEFK
jgi:transcriptional regulator with XRE-family HTH domain